MTACVRREKWARGGCELRGETPSGNIPLPKLMKETRPVGNPTITLEFHCGDRAWRLLGVMGLGTLQRKVVMMTAKSCSGAILPSSFGRVTDLGFEGKRGDY